MFGVVELLNSPEGMEDYWFINFEIWNEIRKTTLELNGIGLKNRFSFL